MIKELAKPFSFLGLRQMNSNGHVKLSLLFWVEESQPTCKYATLELTLWGLLTLVVGGSTH
jgi:hypothetical protein